MANVKNFGLIGVGSDVQYGKTGPRLKHTAGTFQFRNATDAADAALTAAGVTSSAGNVTLTTGNVVLSSNAGVVTLGDAGSISRQATGVFQLSGTGAVIVPNGTQAERPATPAAAMLRFNDDIDQMEYYSGATWVTLATGGATVSSFSGGTTGLTPNTPATGAVVLGGTLNAVNGGTGLSTFAAGTVLYASGADTWAAAAPGATSGVQAYDAGLTALAAKTSTGIMVQTGADTYESRTLVQPAAGITISNADGVGGDPTFALANDLAGLEGLTGTGYSVRTGDGTWTNRSIAGAAGRIVVTNGDGVASNTDVDLATVTNLGNGGSFVKVTTDSYGRVTNSTAVTTADITGLVDSQYLRLDGTSTMAGNIVMGGNKVTGLADPTSAQEAATKNYVDNAISGLSWKQAVQTGSGANVTLATPGATIGGYTLATGDRVLLIGQTDPYENGIYVFDTASTPLVRSNDANTFQELNNAAVFIQDGTYVDSGWVQTATLTSLTTGATQAWVQFSGAGAYTGGTGITVSGNIISANLGAGIVELPSDEIGIDLYDSATGAIILTTDGTTRSTVTGAKLQLLLNGSGGLQQGASGLGIAADGVTNAMLLNDGFTINGDTGTPNQVSLGDTFLIAGTSVQGISTAVTADTITITAADASSSQKGVASFSTVGFTVTAGNVVLNAINLGTMVTGTLPVANGGTGATSFTATRLLIGDGTNPITTDAELTFDTSTNLFTVGTATIAAPTGGDVTITATATNADINLVPNGTGAVVIGPAGAGVIQSDSGQSLTVTGSTTLALTAGTGAVTITSTLGDTVMALAAGTADKVTVTGPTDVQYATGLGSNDLVNKYYVDTVAGSATGDVKAVKATISLASTGSFNIGSALPAGATILQVKVNVTSADTGTGTLVVGKSGGNEYMTASENDTQTVGMYIAEDMVTEAGSEQVQATVGGTPAGAGSATIVVTYQLA